MTRSNAPSGNGRFVASAVRAGTGLAFGAHGGEHAADRRQLLDIQVCGDDVRAATVGLECVTSGPAAEI
jgi:hypothetical protein